MGNARMAEWILSLVTSPERATSTVGDLMEGADSQGTVRFWVSVLHATLSLLLRDLATDPVRMIGLGVLGLACEALLVGLASVAFGLVYGAVLAVMMIAQGKAPVVSDFSSGFTGWYYAAAYWVLAALVDFRVGQWLARKSPGRELTPCVAMTIISFAAGLLILTLITSNQLPMGNWVPEFVAYSTLAAIPLMAGAITIRRRQLRSS